MAPQVQDCNPTVADVHSYTAAESLPILFDDDVATASGFEDIVAYLRNHPAVTNDLDANLSSRQRTDRTAWVPNDQVLGVF